jgi:hypothetical protein
MDCDKPSVKSAYLVALVLAVVFGLAIPAISWAFCNTYEDSRVVYHQGDYFCGGSGRDCTECVNVGSGGYTNSCWTDGWRTVCQDANGGFRVY